MIDVRIKRADLPEKNEQTVFGRMRTERERQAKKFRAEGDEEARKIRSESDKQVQILLADAQQTAQVTRGEGDAQAARIFAEAYGRDPEFYAFVRTLDAYRTSLASGTTVILSPKSEFFRFLERSESRRAAGGDPRRSSSSSWRSWCCAWCARCSRGRTARAGRRRLDGWDPYSVLGVARGASRDEIVQRLPRAAQALPPRPRRRSGPRAAAGRAPEDGRAAARLRRADALTSRLTQPP